MKKERIKFVVFAQIAYENEAARKLAIKEVCRDLGVSIASVGEPGNFRITTGRVIVQQKEPQNG